MGRWVGGWVGGFTSCFDFPADAFGFREGPASEDSVGRAGDEVGGEGGWVGGRVGAAWVVEEGEGVVACVLGRWVEEEGGWVDEVQGFLSLCEGGWVGGWVGGRGYLRLRLSHGGLPYTHGQERKTSSLGRRGRLRASARTPRLVLYGVGGWVGGWVGSLVL